MAANGMQKSQVHFVQSARYSIVLLENTDHPYDVKINYLIGQIKIFDRVEIYSAQLYSTMCLADGLEWDHKFYEQLRDSLTNGILEESEESMFFYVVSKWTNEVLMRCKVKKIIGKNRCQLLLEYMHKFSQQERARKINIQLQLEGQKSIYKKRLEELQNQQLMVEASRMNLLTKLSSLYKEKTKKLVELKDDGGEEPSREVEPELGASQIEGYGMFMPSMDFRS